ncbi:hypothetical protein MMC10_009938 [Thelotrema lepadinum]|nr:hypothetical protein [Thelotrema lepadinum]
MAVLDIEITEPQEVWKPGDEISGVVRVRQNKPLYAQQITVSLKAIAKCRFGLPELNSLYSHQSLLTEQSTSLLPQPANLQEGQSWPFKFILPDKSQERQTPFQEPSRLYNDSSIQPLPPTFTVAKRDTASSQDSCSLTYGIYANIDDGKSKSNLFKHEDLATSRLIYFYPDRRDAAPNWKMVTKRADFECRTPLLNSNGDPKKSLSIKTKVLSTLKPGSLPSATFSVLMSIPRSVVIGQPIPLFVGIQHDIAGSSSRSSPLVELKSLNVKLESLTGLRGLVEGYTGGKYQPASHSSWTKLVELGKFNDSLPLEDITDLRLHLGLQIPEDSDPSFSTFNIARAYTLKIQATVECAKEKFKASFEIYPITLLAGHADDATHPPGIGTRPSLRPGNSDSDSLPTWEESGGYNGLKSLAEKEEEKEEAPPGYA